MEIGTISIRYARALLMVAQDNKTEDLVYQEMKSLFDVFLGNRELKPFFENPIVTSEEKIKILSICAGKIEGKNISQTTENFLRFIVEKKRENFVLFMAMSYMELYRKAKNIISAEVTSVQKLDEKTLSSLLAFIKKGYSDKTIQLNTKINEALIGGFVLNVENEKFDASVLGELNVIRKELMLYHDGDASRV